MNETILYRSYNQTELDAQYNNRAMVPEHVDIHAAFEDLGVDDLDELLQL